MNLALKVIETETTTKIFLLIKNNWIELLFFCIIIDWTMEPIDAEDVGNGILSKNNPQTSQLQQLQTEVI